MVFRTLFDTSHCEFELCEILNNNRLKGVIGIENSVGQLIIF